MKRKRTQFIDIAIALAVFCVSALSVINGRAESQELSMAKQAAAIRWTELSSNYIAPIAITAVVGIIFVVFITATALACALVVWTWRRATMVYPNNGLFPLVRDYRLLNPNEPGAQIAARLPAARAGTILPKDSKSSVIDIQHEELPSRVPLRGLLDGKPSINNLVLGVSIGEDGKNQILRANLETLVHILVAGASGWGKSQFLKMLVYQLATAQEPVDLVLADLEMVTFSNFHNSNRLLYPVIDDEAILARVLDELVDELARRKELYKAYPGLDSLSAYNEASEEKLRPIVLAIDEATSFLSDRSVGEGLKVIARRGRKYGLWCTAGGQTFGYKDVPTGTSQQFSTRFQFRAPVKNSSQTLVDSSDARELDVPGRALCSLPGKKLQCIQAPFVSSEEIARAILTGEPGRPLPVIPDAEEDARDEKIRAMAAQGHNKSEIELELFKYNGGEASRIVKAVLGPTTTTGRAKKRRKRSSS